MGAVLPLRFLFIAGFVPILTGFCGVGSTSDRTLTPIPYGLYHSRRVSCVLPKKFLDLVTVLLKLGKICDFYWESDVFVSLIEDLLRLSEQILLWTTNIFDECDALLKEIKAMVVRHPDTLTTETIKAGNKGYAAEVLVVTFNRRTKHADDKSKFRILLSFGQHGRELITTEVALQLLSVLAEEHSMQSMDLMSLHNVLDNLVIKMVPMENLNGRKLVEATDRCERRNGRGVDLNRNWGVDWGKKEKDYNPYEENPGTAPFSEPEAQIIRQLAKSFEPHIWANVHSGIEALFMPYDHRNITPGGSTSSLMDLVLRELNHLHFEDKCLVGSGGGLVGYLAHGTTTDYMYDVIKVPMAFTFEIYGDPEASSKDCFKMFNPIDKHVFKKTVNNWTAAFLTLFKLGTLLLGDAHFAPSTDLRKWVPFGDRVADGKPCRRDQGQDGWT